MKNRIITLLTIVAAMGCTNQPTDQAAAIVEARTKEVLDHHVKAFLDNDLEATLADYTEESILVTPDVTYKGLAEIRKNFENAFAVLPKDSITFTLTHTIVVQDLAYIIWQAKTPKLDFSYATDTFIIRDGKIVRQTYAGAVTPL
jgi:hypothetical protein